jgi:hypothetical protein
MTVPTLAAAVAFGNNTAEVNATYTYDSPSADELIIIIHGNDSNNDFPGFPGSPDPAVIITENSPASSHGYGVGYLKAAGTEGTGTFDLTHDGSSAEEWAGYYLRIQGWDGTTAPEVGARTGTATDNRTRACSLTPSWDSSTDDTLWIWVSTTDGSAITITGGYPTELTANTQQTSPGTGSPNVAIGTATTSIATFATVNFATVNMSGSINHTEFIIGVKGAGAGGGGATPHQPFGLSFNGPFGGPLA